MEYIRIAVDPLFPPPYRSNHIKKEIPENIFENNRFELIYDDIVDKTDMK